MKLNNNQKLAVDNIDGNILVNAGAGTGKSATRSIVKSYCTII